jgi:hypothetical protein
MLVAASLLTGSSAANAATDTNLSVTTIAAPVWLADNAMRVEYVIDNARSAFFCEPATVELTWASAGGRWHHKYAQAAMTAGVATGMFTIPGRTVWPGVMRYQVRASQSCGLAFSGSRTYTGQSPTAGYSHSTIK